MKQDFAKLVRESWQKDGGGIDPQRLAEWTPHQIAAVFCAPKDLKEAPLDKVQLIARKNESLAKQGKRPEAPSWLLPKLKGKP